MEAFYPQGALRNYGRIPNFKLASLAKPAISVLASTLADKAIDTAVGAISSSFHRPSVKKDLSFNNIKRYSTTMAPIRRRRFKRRMRFPKKRTMYRKKRTVRRKRGRSMVAGKGALQRRFNSGMVGRLNTNMRRNDYDSVREELRSTVASPSTVAVQVVYGKFQVFNFTRALAKMNDYDEYRITGVQLLITPLIFNSMDRLLAMADNFDPYWYLIPRVHPDQWSVIPSYKQIRETPGIIKIHLLQKKPICINLPVFAEVEDEMKTDTGTYIQVKSPFKKVGFVHNNTPKGSVPVSAEHLKFGHYAAYFPQLDGVNNVFIPRFRFDFYATILFRNCRDNVLV